MELVRLTSYEETKTTILQLNPIKCEAQPISVKLPVAARAALSFPSLWPRATTTPFPHSSTAMFTTSLSVAAASDIPRHQEGHLCRASRVPCMAAIDDRLLFIHHCEWPKATVGTPPSFVAVAKCGKATALFPFIMAASPYVVLDSPEPPQNHVPLSSAANHG